MKLGILDLVQPPLGLGLFIESIPASAIGQLPQVSASMLSTIPSAVRNLLAVLSVEELHMAHDDKAVVYYGRVQIGGDGLAGDPPVYKSPSGHLIEPVGMGFEFRITFPRVGSQTFSDKINEVITDLDTAANKADLGDLRTTLDLLGGKQAPNISSDYPTKSFHIELLFNSIIIHLPKTFVPARLAADGWLEPDPNFEEVIISLPKIAMSIIQDADDYNNISVRFDGWGIHSLDDETELKAGELASMTPSLCLHKGNVGFGIEKIVMDFSRDFTPPEILEKNFGIGDDFRGIWIPRARIFYAHNGLKGMAFDTWGEDLLFDMDQGFSGEIGMELVNNVNRGPFEVDVMIYDLELKSPHVYRDLRVGNNVTRESYSPAGNKGEIQVRVRGGKPPYSISVKKDGILVPGQPYKGDADRLSYPINETKEGECIISVRVEDSLSPARFWQEILELTLIDIEKNLTRQNTHVQEPQLRQLTGGDQYQIVLSKNDKDNNFAFVKTIPDNATLTADGIPVSRNPNKGAYPVAVIRNGTEVAIEASWPSVTHPENFKPFNPDNPADNSGENTFLLQFEFKNPEPGENPVDVINGLKYKMGDAGVNQFLARRQGRSLKIYGFSSYEKQPDTRESAEAAYRKRNEELSQRRADIMLSYLKDYDAGLTPGEIKAEGHTAAKAHGTNDSDDYRIAIATYPQLNPVPITATAKLWRDKDKIDKITQKIEPAPAPKEPERPSAFRRIAIRARWQRGELVFGELSGEFDVIEETKRSGALIQQADDDNAANLDEAVNAITTSPGASALPDTAENKGVIDFKLSILYDTATGKLTQTLTLGFDQSNAKEGFVSIKKGLLGPLANTIASLLLFAPLLQGGIEAVQSSTTDEDRTTALAIAGAEIGVATVLGLFAIKMEQITIFGAEFTLSEISPDIYLWNAGAITDGGILLDYAVDFKIDFNLFNILTIRTKERLEPTGPVLLPPRARYKAIGFKLVKDPATKKIKYQPVFDTSKGYELSLGDPGALEVTALGVNLNNLLRILSVRLSRENPMVLEVDMAMNVNLGIISVDNLRVRLKIQDDGTRNFEIIPTKISVNIPGAIAGTGYLDFGNSSGSGSVSGASGGFQGYVDLTLLPLKLRIAATVGIKPIHDPVSGRDATAFFLGMEVDLPSAIPLANTGLGIYGFLGLFAMHYQRTEQPSAIDELPPALKWFYNPPVQGNVINIQGWRPALDKWSFGLGMILGTQEGGFVLNMKGMFILELPGPRILIFVKVSLLSKKPDNVKAAGRDITAGLLAVVDLDFNINRLTIGLVMEYSIESVLSLRIPVVSQFNFDNPRNWFLDLGNNKVPAEALILGIVRGYAYLMVHGNGINDWPEDGLSLNGFSLALGIGASLVFGDKDSGLYLEVGGDLAAGISFSPFYFFGKLRLRGQLHLWIVSVSAHAELEVEGPNPNTYIHGEACGGVDCFFFSIEGCVYIEINKPLAKQPPPDLLFSLTLVSRSSALMAGQGIDRPIDGALGKAARVGIDDISDNKLLVVPIDSMPVLNLFATPDVTGCTVFNETGIIDQSSTFTQDGWVNTGAKKSVRYRLKSIKLNNALLEADKPKPIKFWKKPTDRESDDESGVDLALLCWSPSPTPRAVQRSKDLTTTVTNRWERVCKQVAPATSVFYTFNLKPLGYSTAGWTLAGKAWPDTPGTIRSKPADTALYVYENRFPDDLPGMMDAWTAIRKAILDHAKVIGPQQATQSLVGSPRIGRVLQFPFDALFAPDTQPPITLSESTIKAIKNFDAENIILDTGELNAAEILLTLYSDVIKPEQIIIRSLDRNFKVIKEASVADIGFTVVNAIIDLPTHWLETAGPWVQDLTPVLSLLAQLSRIKKQLKILLHYKGFKEMRYIQVFAKRSTLTPDGPALLLCAMELLTAAEFKREQHDTTTQESDKDTLNDALLGEPLRALLKPGTRYELSVDYEFQQRNETGAVETTNHVPIPAPITYVFKTDAKAPLRLDPWIFASTPQNDMKYHFKDDPVQIYLNDESVIQLFKAYNVALIARVLAANGSHPRVADPGKLKLDMTNTSQVKKVKAAIKTPYNHTLEEVAQGILPCINDSGVKEEHLVFTIGVEMLLNTEYSVEVVKEGEIFNPADNGYRSPMYKIAFRTSRYNSAEKFASDIMNARHNTGLLRSHLDGSLNEECSDIDMQNKLYDAGFAISKQQDITVSFLWSSIASGAVVENKLEAIMIDTPEPLWRKRPYPHEETLPSESGDMKHWVMKDKLEMEVIEAADSSVVKKMVRTKGGARTILFLTSNAAGQQVHLQLKKHIFTHVMLDYNTSATFRLFDMMNLQLPSKAPWETEE